MGDPGSQKWVNWLHFKFCLFWNGLKGKDRNETDLQTKHHALVSQILEIGS